MSLRTCPECDGKVSEHAPLCVHCGFPFHAVVCTNCGIYFELSTAVYRGQPISDPGAWFISELPPVGPQVTKQDVLFKRGLAEAARHRGSAANVRQRLAILWERDRAELLASVSDAARTEFSRYTREKRKEIHRCGEWKHEETRLLHMAYEQRSVHAAYVGAIIDAWLKIPAFDSDVQAYLNGDLSGRVLLERAKLAIRRTPPLES
jgi:hypothetical protein